MKTRRYTAEQFVRTYLSWMAAMQRCVYRSNHRRDFKDYAGRGIKMYRPWRRFVRFIADVGPRPSARHTLDRFPDNGGDYRPGNVRWATPRQQASNRRSTVWVTFRGETLPRSEWARRTGLSPWTIGLRIRRGWSVRDALTVLPQARNPAYKSFASGRRQGKKLSLADVKEIVRRAKVGATAASLGRLFGVSGVAVAHVCKQFGVRFKKGRPRCS